MKRNKIKLLILLLTTVLLLGVALCAYADEQYLKNVQISSDGVLSWETDLTDEEYLTVGTLSTLNVKGMSSISLYDLCKNNHLESNTYQVELVVRKYIDKWEYYVTRTWEGTYTYEAPTSYTITVNGGKAYKAGGAEITSAQEGDSVFISFDESVVPAGKYLAWGDCVDGDYNHQLGMLSGTSYDDCITMPARNVTLTPRFEEQTPLSMDLTSGSSKENAKDIYWTLAIGDDKGIVTESGSAYVYEYDLDKDGTKDVTYKEYDEEFSVNSTCSLSGTYVVTVPNVEHSPITFKFPAAAYPVWVGGTRVTEDNRNDILGDGGKARFNPSTNTLTLNNPTISGMHEQAMIYALGIDLTAEGKATLNYAEAATAFNVAADGVNGGKLTLNGDFSISGSGLMSAVWADSCITVKGGSVTCVGGGWGFHTNGDIKIEAGTVEISSGFTGIRAANGNITISGGTVTATGSEEGTGDGAGISSGGKVEIANATVTAKGRVHGIAAGGDITIAGNRVTAETWVQNESQALRADGNLTISGGTVTTKTAATGIHSKGSIKIENGTEKVETYAKKHAASAGTALVIGDGLMIKEPAGGIIQEGYIYEAGGTTEATYALIVPKEVTYPVWVGGTQATESNKNDILGDGGKARFDPSTNTLTLNGLTAGDGLHASGASIVSTGIDLSVKGSATLSGSGYGIYVSKNSEGGGNLTLDGATITYAVAGGSDSGIRADGNISISNSTIDVIAAKNGILAGGSISINGGTVTSEAAGKGICASHGNITISGGTVKATSSAGVNAGMEALNGKVEIKNGINSVTADGAGTALGAGNIMIGDELMIKEPEGGTVGDIPGAYVIKNPDDSIATHVLIVPKEASVPSWTVTFDANGHGTAPTAQTVTDGGTAVKPADPTETGWTFGGWYTDAACTTAFDFSTPVTGNLKLFAKWTEGSSAPTTPATYSVVSITNNAWTKGSGSSVVITVKRSEADETCFSHFTGVQIDGAALPSGAYEAKAGSTVVTLKAETLQKLSAGNHSVAIHFDDGKAEANLTVKDAADTAVPDVPKTGDKSPIGLWIALTVLSAAGLCALTGAGRKRRNAGRR